MSDDARKGKRETLGRELTALANRVEALYAGHIIGFDKAIATLKTVPQAALDVIASAVTEEKNDCVFCLIYSRFLRTDVCLETITCNR